MRSIVSALGISLAGGALGAVIMWVIVGRLAINGVLVGWMVTLVGWFVSARLSERAQTLLRVLIESYIRDGQPVGSRVLSRDSGLQLSSATIRNVMADLEEYGFVSSLTMTLTCRDSRWGISALTDSATRGSVNLPTSAHSRTGKPIGCLSSHTSRYEAAPL